MKLDLAVLRTILRPAWLLLIVGSTLIASLTALWVGLQQDAGETSTTFVFGRRVGFLDRPLPVLDDHLNEIINSVEFPEVFERIENRLLLQAERDYDLQIGTVDDTQSLVQITVRTNRSGEAERIARIIAEEMVAFVLDSQDVAIETEIDDLAANISRLQDEQANIVDLAGGVPPTTAARVIEAQLANIARGQIVDPVAGFEEDLRSQLLELQPLSTTYQTNAQTIRTQETQRAQSQVERLDIVSGQVSINDDWYRLITPVEPTSNVPVAIAMAFAAGVPALVVATTLAVLLISRSLHRRRAIKEERVSSVVDERRAASA